MGCLKIWEFVRTASFPHFHLLARSRTEFLSPCIFRSSERIEMATVVVVDAAPAAAVQQNFQGFAEACRDGDVTYVDNFTTSLSLQDRENYVI